MYLYICVCDVCVCVSVCECVRECVCECVWICMYIIIDENEDYYNVDDNDANACYINDHITDGDKRGYTIT